MKALNGFQFNSAKNSLAPNLAPDVVKYQLSQALHGLAGIQMEYGGLLLFQEERQIAITRCKGSLCRPLADRGRAAMIKPGASGCLIQLQVHKV